MVLNIIKRICIPLANEKGATAIEYSIIAALIAAVIIAMVSQIGIKVRSFFVINGW